MKKEKPVKAENIRSENFMMELFGYTNKEFFRKFAKREGFRIANITQKTRLYDMADVVRLFGIHSVS